MGLWDAGEVPHDVGLGFNRKLQGTSTGTSARRSMPGAATLVLSESQLAQQGMRGNWRVLFIARTEENAQC